MYRLIIGDNFKTTAKPIAQDDIVYKGKHVVVCSNINLYGSESYDIIHIGTGCSLTPTIYKKRSATRIAKVIDIYDIDWAMIRKWQHDSRTGKIKGMTDDVKQLRDFTYGTYFDLR